MYDYHLHSEFSIDSKIPMETMVQAGINKNLKSLCFTDHVDLESTPNKIDIQFRPDDYFKNINKVKYKYKNFIEVAAGVEIGMQSHLGKRYEDFINNNPFDFVIMSIHAIDGKDLYIDEYLKDKEPLFAIQEYYKTMYMCLQKYDEFDTLGHIDFIDRYFDDYKDIPKFQKYSDIVEGILKILIEKGKALEINTAGLRYGLDYFHPKMQILKLYRDLGGELLTIGSDAHTPDNIGYEYKFAEKALKELGFKYIYIFKERKKFPIKI
jgi:histidinol-phosphatase (PHP family)